MSTRASRTDEIRVTLARPGVGKEEIKLPAGSTVADLLANARAPRESQDIFVDGHPLEEAFVLKPGMVVHVVPRLRNASSGSSWRETVGMFRDDPTFQEMVEAGKAYRDSQREAADDESSDAAR